MSIINLSAHCCACLFPHAEQYRTEKSLRAGGISPDGISHSAILLRFGMLYVFIVRGVSAEISHIFDSAIDLSDAD